MSSARVLVPLLALPALAAAVESTRALPLRGWASGGFLTFDGRLAFGRHDDPQPGIHVQVFRPDAVAHDGGGYPVFDDGAFSAPVEVDEAYPTQNYNSFAACSEDPSRAPYRCDADGGERQDAGGAYDCYDLYLFQNTPVDTDGDGEWDGPDNLMIQRLHILVVVSDPGTPEAAVDRVEVFEHATPIEPAVYGWDMTMTRDGRMIVLDAGEVHYTLLSEDEPRCALTGWSDERPLARMHDDPEAARYPLAQAPMTDAAGLPLTSVTGAYSWVFPDGDNVLTQGYGPDCQEPGNSSIRAAAYVIGRSTRWTAQQVDGDLNVARGTDPDADPCHLVFFLGSPALFALPDIPATPSAEAWPLFVGIGRYTEILLDDSLDDEALAVWHMNEIVRDDQYYLGHVPDASGHLHTAHLSGGAEVGEFNMGPVGRALFLPGDGGAMEASEEEIAAGGQTFAVGSSPAPGGEAGLTVAAWVQPHGAPECEAPVVAMDGSFALTIGEDLRVRATVAAGEGAWDSGAVGPALPPGRFSHVLLAYDAVAGRAELRVLGEMVAAGDAGPGPVGEASGPLRVGGAGACGGGMRGLVDEVIVLARPAPAEEACFRAARATGCAGTPPVIALEMGGDLPVISLADAEGAENLDLRTFQVWVNGGLAEEATGNADALLESGLLAPLDDGTGYRIDVVGAGFPLPEIEPAYRALRVVVGDADGNVTVTTASLEAEWPSSSLDPLDLVDAITPEDPATPADEAPAGESADGGCGCAVGSRSAPAPWLLAIVALAALVRRRAAAIAGRGATAVVALAALLALVGCGAASDEVAASEGEQLFRTQQFDGNGRVCATCHVPEEGFTLSPAAVAARPADDPLFDPIDSDEGDGDSYEILTTYALSAAALALPDNVEVEGEPDRRTIRVFRSVPALANLEETGPFQWDGRFESLEEQVWSSLRDHFAMQRSPTPEEIAAIVAYEQESRPEPPAAEVGGGAAARGETLFLGEARCGSCHGGPLLHRASDVQAPEFVNTGVAARNLAGRPVLAFVFHTGKQDVVVETPDPGRAATTGDPADAGAMEIPSLVGMSRTAPYFHDHSAATIEDVLDHYDGFLEGGLRLDAGERADLAAYLATL